MNFKFLAVLGLGVALFSGELFFTVWENDQDTAARKLNQISEGEAWWLAGSIFTPPASRLLYQGPVGNPEDFLEHDPELGYHLKRNLKALPGRLRRGGTTIYDVTYSTDREGRRPTVYGTSGGLVAFFGDSYVFGHGLGESETLPAQFAKAMNVTTLNFGVPGWGPHQVLRLLELQRETHELYGNRFSKAFFLLIREHLPRMAGLRLESAGSPRYEFKGNEPVLAGHFPLPGSWSEACGYSAICSAFRARWREHSSAAPELGASPEELTLVMKKIAAILKERHRCGLTVISWNVGDESMTALEKSLQSSGIDVVPVSQAIPDFLANITAYVVPFDGHPNAIAMRKLGKYLAERLER